MRLDGNRIVLRELVAGDWTALHDAASRSEVYRFQPWGPVTPDDTRSYVEAVLKAADQQPRSEYTFAVLLQKTGHFVGYGSLWIRHERFRTGEIGFFLHPDRWGQGLGTEIARLLLQSGFEHFHLHRIYATCDPRNIESKRVLEKIGLIHEGRLRHTMLIRDGWRNSDVYSMLEHEWKAVVLEGPSHRIWDGEGDGD